MAGPYDVRFAVGGSKESNPWADFRLSPHLSVALQPFVLPWPLFQFLNPIHSRQHSLDGESSRLKAAAYTQNNTNTEQTTQTSMPPVGSKPTTPVFKGEDGHFDRHFLHIIGTKLRDLLLRLVK
jgi:hypothetical protein